MKAKIDNNIVTVKMVNANYNDHASEVQILEGTHKGNYTIVENTDIIEEVKTIKQLETLVKNDIKDFTGEELDNYNLVELISSNTYNLAKESSNTYKLSNREFTLLIDNNYGEYSSSDTIEDVKTNILLDVIESRLNGDKASFTSIKKRALDVVKDAYNL